MAQADDSRDGQIGYQEYAAATILRDDLTDDVIKRCFDKLDIMHEEILTAESIFKYYASRA